MCRNIKPLFNFEPAATHEEIHDAALQFVRKVSGFKEPSEVNQEAFEKAVKEIAESTKKLIDHLETTAPKKNREEEIEKRRIRNKKRFG